VTLTAGISMRTGHQIAALLAIAGAALVLAGAGVGAGTDRTEVPLLLGLSEARAEKRLAARSLHAEVLRRPAGAHRLPRRYRVAGQIVFQDYRRGIVLPKGSSVRVIVYKPRRG